MRRHKNRLNDHFPLQTLLIDIGLVIGICLLLLGIFWPLMTVKKLWVFSNTVSLASGLTQLMDQGEWALFLVIGLFSILLPLLKFVLLAAMTNLVPVDQTGMHRPLHWLVIIGKWSMLDVFVVALMIVSIKLGGIAEIQVHNGVYAFCAAVLLTMVLTQWVMALSKKARATATPED